VDIDTAITNTAWVKASGSSVMGNSATITASASFFEQTSKIYLPVIVKK
jgi:hypothetical protein